MLDSVCSQSLIVLLLLLGWCRERGRCSSAAFPCAPLIIHVLRQRTLILEEGKIFAGLLGLFSVGKGVAAHSASLHT